MDLQTTKMDEAVWPEQKITSCHGKFFMDFIFFNNLWSSEHKLGTIINSRSIFFNSQHDYCCPNPCWHICLNKPS
jgi:hypothetical protein